MCTKLKQLLFLPNKILYPSVVCFNRWSILVLYQCSVLTNIVYKILCKFIAECIFIMKNVFEHAVHEICCNLNILLCIFFLVLYLCKYRMYSVYSLTFTFGAICLKCNVTSHDVKIFYGYDKLLKWWKKVVFLCSLGHILMSFWLFCLFVIVLICL